MFPHLNLLSAQMESLYNLSATIIGSLDVVFGDTDRYGIPVVRFADR
jgi:hypothetical protein